jgi:quaternary ammonium compound-resistance protein SugE
MSWRLLFAAGLFEVAWATGPEYSEGLSKPVSTAGTVVALIISMVLLANAVNELPIGIAYAVWTGIGAVGTATLGIVLFDEPATGARLLFISVMVFGIVGLHFVSGGH